MSVAEMKPSQVLREALAKLDGGKKWCKQDYYAGESCCSLGALRRVLSGPYLDNLVYLDSRCYLASAVNIGDPCEIPEWNDAAANFSVIEQGFQKAIALAESEGK